MKCSKWLIAFTVVCIGIGGVLWLNASVRAGFPLGLLRLSDSTDVCDIEPRSAISDDGTWLAAVWIRGKLVNQACVYRNQVVISSATETDAQQGWSEPTDLPLPSGACAVHADVSISGTTAHVAATYWSPCDAGNADSAIRYYTCDLLAGDVCTTIGDAVYQSGIQDRRLSDVRIVLDDQNRPQIAYAAGQHNLAQGDIYYIHLTDTGWSTPVKVSTGDKIDGFYRPAIAESDGRVHFTWERHRNAVDGLGQLRSRGDVQYRYCDIATGTCHPDIPISYVYPDSLDETTYPLPSIAAQDGHVFIVWNVCADYNVNAPCEEFYLVYARSNDNGQTLSQPKEVISEEAIDAVAFFSHKYPGTDSATDLYSSYATHTRPSVKLDSQLLPHLAWQVETDSGYAITTTHAIAQTSNSFTWATPSPIWSSESVSTTRFLPALVLANPSQEALGMHVIHMQAWWESVGATSRSRSQIYYDYLGMRHYTLESSGPPMATYQLPAEREIPIRAQVKDLSGNGIANAQVIFMTDHGSFDYEGFGTKQAVRVSDDDGWTEALLYSNLTGTASVNVWLDLTPDEQRDNGEPAIAYTHTLTTSISPAVWTLETSILSGDLITATLFGHPYETTSYLDWAMPYMLWWCPVGNAEPIYEPAAGPIVMDIASWSRYDLPIQVPLNADGTYYLESREDGEDSPCDPYLRVARSADITASETPPPGVAWLDLSDSQPRVGTLMNVTLKQHDADTYELWWCPASGASAPVSEMVANGVVVGSGMDKSVTITVPISAEGLYRLESHDFGGSCGNTQTRQAASSLLQPELAIFFPLVTK